MLRTYRHAILIAAALAAVLTFVVIKCVGSSSAQGRRVRGPTDHRAAPSRRPSSRRREAELEIKELAIQQKAEGEKELRKLREELHERERILDKRQDALEKQAEQLQKQEKIVEGTQRKLTERIQDTNRRKEELAKLLDLQRQTLHELSGLSREEATARLLEGPRNRTPAGDRRGHPQAREAASPRPARRNRARCC